MEKHVVVETYEQNDWNALICKLGDLTLVESLKGLNQLLIHCRWELKDISEIVRISDFAVTHLGDSEDPEALATFKAICFNRAAFCWRGWGDEDVVITREIEAAATSFAERNLSLAHKLGKEGTPMGRAEWLMGAYDWANGDCESAAHRFDRATQLVQSGDDPLETKMMHAYTLAVRGEDPNQLLSELEASENGEFYAQQVRSAMKVYGSQ